MAIGKHSNSNSLIYYTHMFDINTKHLPDRKSHKTTNNFIVSVIGIGQLVFKILVIGISVKSHIGTTLLNICGLIGVTEPEVKKIF